MNLRTLSLLLISTMTVMSGITIVATLPLMAKHFANVENIEFNVKLLLTLPSIAIALLAPLAGYFSDKIGRLKPLFAGMVLFILSGSAGLYLENFYWLLFSRALLGLSVALIMTAQTALIGDYFKEHARHSYMAKQGMAVGFGGIIFIASGGFLAQMHWSYPFAIYLIPALFLPVALVALREPQRHKQTLELEEFPSKKMLPIYASGFGIMLLFYMMPTQLPFLIAGKLHGSPLQIGLFISIAMFFNAILASQYAKLRAQLSYMQIFSFSLISFGIGTLNIAFATSLSQLYMSTLFVGAGFGLMLVNLNAWFLSRVNANKRGRSSGILTSAIFLGQFSSPLLLQPIVTASSIEALFKLVALTTFLLGILLMLTHRFKRVTS